MKAMTEARMSRLGTVEEAHQTITLAVHDAMLRHKAAGVPMAVWENERVVLIQPEDIVIPDLED